MILVLGGAYQGKLDYVKEKILPDGKVYTVEENDDGFREEALRADIIYGMEKFVYSCEKAGKEAIEEIDNFFGEDDDKVFIFDDISAGLVPMDALDRAWREHNGRTMILLAQRAEQVHRVFCGLGQRLK